MHERSQHQAWQVPTPGMAGPNMLFQTWGGRTMLRGVILAVQSLLHTNISWNSCWELRIITRHFFHRWRCTRVGVGGVVSTFHCKLLLVIRREGIDYENKGNDPYDHGKILHDCDFFGGYGKSHLCYTCINHIRVTVSVTALSMVLIGVTIYVQTIVKSGNITPHRAGQAHFSKWCHMHLMNTPADSDCVQQLTRTAVITTGKCI